MRHFLLVAPLLLGACATPTPSQPGPLPQPLPTVSQPAVPKFFCNAAARSSVYSGSQKWNEEIWMPEPGDRSAALGPFRFRVLYSDDHYESPTFITYVYSTSTGKLIQESLFQFDRQKGPVNQMDGGNDFTGGHYVYAPDSGAELQYWCRRV